MLNQMNTVHLRRTKLPLSSIPIKRGVPVQSQNGPRMGSDFAASESAERVKENPDHCVEYLVARLASKDQEVLERPRWALCTE